MWLALHGYIFNAEVMTTLEPVMSKLEVLKINL